ncbi:hypothetical protein SARC_08604 [Sphaeroforma arctica JP610]|uniref:Uncharacterized protein n=1 Tax=Sphaeroforma arctica JP610 TaxID=667725 RepID=A0A0L0FQK4_9EUKA|nr:hypothetical protein SARC_08604 [Sphaeroforma arctica JP610]KNC78989.1 hypothetical protein SARC_08604 [Sphaeroforma arctica JP610]|eukprot:XP_014152891.1 hypothetical protein SARC_08604 [Sphaeroforma arctica JP610]
MVFPLQPNIHNYNQTKLQLHSYVEVIKTTADTFLQSGTEIPGPPKWRYICIARVVSTIHTVPPTTELLDAKAKCTYRPRATPVPANAQTSSVTQNKGREYFATSWNVFHVDLHTGLPAFPTGYAYNIKYVDANSGQPFIYPLNHKDDTSATLDLFYTDIGKTTSQISENSNAIVVEILSPRILPVSTHSSTLSSLGEDHIEVCE